MYGGVGCLGTPVVRTDAAAVRRSLCTSHGFFPPSFSESIPCFQIWSTGKTWWQVPPVTNVVLHGALRPGVTGLTQVRQGYDNSIEDVRRKVGFDAAYAMQLSTLRGWLVADLSIMFATVRIMITGRGAQ